MAQGDAAIGQKAGAMLPAAPCAAASAVRERRWAVILAGGDGSRLQSLTRFICGDERPKQFCPLLEGQSLLEHTIRRAESSVSKERTLFALTHAHRKFYVGQLDGFPHQRIVQPVNKGTAPPILFSILSIAAMDPDALVAILPSDHHYADEARLTAALESAFEAAAAHPESVVLLGAEPDHPEVEYGWIELGASVGGRPGQIHRVRGFWEKPSLEVAEALLGERSAWNTFVMVGHVGAFLDLMSQAIPELMRAVRRTQLWSGSEVHIPESAYQHMAVSDFSKQVLSVEIARLLVLRAGGLGWSDLGHPGRVLEVLEGINSKPEWMTEWRREDRKSAAGLRVRSAVA